jgi:adenylate cyclase class IV
VRNFEIKCRYPRQREAERISINEIGAAFSGRLEQTDVYFNVPSGRLKLRYNRFYPPKGSVSTNDQLIFYDRADEKLPRTSSYEILALSDGPGVEKFLARAFGVKVRVRKSRKLFLTEALRIHIDSVRSLGKFLEFELIVSPENSMARCRKRMRDLITLFRIESEQIVPCSYSDLVVGQLDSGPAAG